MMHYRLTREHLLYSSLLACIGAGACARASLGMMQPRLACSIEATDTPRALVDTTKVRRIARYVQAAEWNGRVVTVGTDLPFFTGKTASDSLLFAFADSANLGSPAGTWRFAYPRIANSAVASFVLVWGQTDSSSGPAIALPVQRINSLWASVYSATNGWSNATALFAANRIRWNPDGAAMVSARDGIATYGVAAVDEARVVDPHLVFFRRRDGIWMTREVAGTRGAIYSDVAVDETGRIAIAYVAPDWSVPKDGNSVFVVTSNDRGDTWNSPVLLSRSGGNRAAAPKILIGPDAAIHVLWRQSYAGGVPSDVIRHVNSEDGAARWSAASDLSAAPGFLRFVAAIDACNIVHVAYEDWHGGGNEGDVDYAQWHGAWTGPTHVLKGWLSIDPLLWIDAREQVHLFVLGRPVAATMLGALANLEVMLKRR